MAIFAKLAYDEGASVLSVLSTRFLIATAVFWAVIAARGGLRGATIPRRTLIGALALGAFGYSLQAGLFFASLTRIDASLASLLLYAYPCLLYTSDAADE